MKKIERDEREKRETERLDIEEKYRLKEEALKKQFEQEDQDEIINL